MKLKRVLTIFFSVLLAICCTITTFAHSGRTDSSGGHKDNKNKSGLGSYHYHCGGYPAHLHNGGYCPYTDIFPSSVSISVGKKVLGIGEKTDISGAVYPANSCNTNITWDCSDSSVVRMKNGTIEAVGYGTATITAKSFNGKVGTVRITVKEITAEKVTINNIPSDDKLYIGESFQLTSTITPSNVDNPTITWSSSDSAKATVDNKGNVVLKDSGNVKIEATASNGVKGVWQAQVKERFVESINIDETELSMLLGSTYALKASVTPSNATHPELQWSTSDANIVDVSADGTLTAVSCGNAVVTAISTNDISKSVEITVNEIVAESISVEGENTILLGEDTVLSATILPENTTVKDVAWSVDDTSIASISEDGRITALTIGTTIVRAKQKDVETYLEISVLPIDVTEIIITSSNGSSLNKDETTEFSAEIVPNNATYKNITWSTSDESIATIDENGVLTTHSTGTVMVIATTDGGFVAEYELNVVSPVAGLIALLGVGGAAAGIGVAVKKKKKSKK